MNPLLIVLFSLALHPASPPEGDSLVWPAPPERARIAYVTSISSGAQFKEEDGVFSRVLKFFFGGEDATPWLVQPVGIAVNTKGVIYIADPGAAGVHRIDLKEKKHTLVQETGDGPYKSPVGVACAADGTVYVTDSELHEIIVADEDLNPKKTIRKEVERPTGITIIGGVLYVVDTGLHGVSKFDPDGNFLASFGRRGTGNGEFNFPVQIAGTDTLCVVDALNYRIQLFTRSGAFVRSFGQQGNAVGRFASPKAVATDSDGDLYITDALMDNIQVFNPLGQLLLSMGRQGAGNGEFMSPNGIAIDASNLIYVVETLNRRIQIFRYLK